MKTYMISACFALAATTVSAGCVGSEWYQNCYDNGNSYTINRYGNTTTMNGYNSQTGSSWSQTSNTYGNTTFHNGSTNGAPWSMRQTVTPYGQTYSGTDSSGSSFYTTCDNYGNCY